MIAKVKNFFKKNKEFVQIVVLVFLLCLLSFGIGMLFERSLGKAPLEVEEMRE